MVAKPGVARAVAAARAVALAHSVACEDAVVVAAGSNVLVHLKPAPVIARVMTGTAMLHADVERWLSREVAVGMFLGERGLAVPPTDVLAPGPHHHGGLWMTFWRFVEHDASRRLPSADELGGAIRELHAGLADFPGQLGQLSEVRDWLDRLLGELQPSPGLSRQDRDLLRLRLSELTATVFESSLPSQAIHADASISNLLRTGNGLIWNDLEDACIGPIHWDVAGLVVEPRAAGEGEPFVADLLRAYGGPEIRASVQEFTAAHVLYTIVWQAFEAQRRQSTAGAATSEPLPLAHVREPAANQAGAVEVRAPAPSAARLAQQPRPADPGCASDASRRRGE